MPAPIIPWSPSNIPLEIQEELDRRKTVKNFNYIANNVANWDSNGNWSSYKGPLMPWIRMCSNSAGHPAVNIPRFVLHGGKGFYQTYGFQPPGSSTDAVRTTTPSSKYQIIGYSPTDPPYPHIIENSLVGTVNFENGGETNYPIHVPTPEISKATITVQKELYRRAEVEWTCFSWEQLVYMTPYFLIPGISIMLEWGWNHFNPISLVKLDDENLMAKLWRNAYPLYIKNIIDSKGNYDVIYGIVTNFNWSMEGNKIICMTEITSKDRLYAGISKDMGLTVNDNKDENAPRPVFQALKDFVNKDATLLNLKTIAEAEPGTELTKLTGGTTSITGSVKGSETQNIIWLDILSSILSEPDANIRGMKVPYIHGVFSGRSKKFYDDKFGLGRPSKNDFDKSNVDKLDAKKIWINMGMIVEILNYFSGLDGGKGEPMFQVDIMNSVIGGHPNMISCNRSVLIPNRRAPKVLWGLVGKKLNGDESEYSKQVLFPTQAKTPADKTLRRVCYQNVFSTNSPKPSGLVCFRNDIDFPINYFRYKFRTSTRRGAGYLGHTNYMDGFSFPAIETKQLPMSSTGIGDPKTKKANVVEADVSGLLSDIYISYSAFLTTILDQDPKSASYVDIYRKLLSILNDAVDGYWDLALVEVDNIMTIADRNYTPTQKLLGQDKNPTYTFDYFDSDSIIRAIRFRPALSDAQATRAIYGEVNNKTSKYVFVDKNDLLNYQFKDAIVMNKKDRQQGDIQSDLAKRKTAQQQIRDVLSEAQKLSTTEDDDTLQMTINWGTTQTRVTQFAGGFAPPVQTVTTEQTGPFEYLKLCLPSSVAKQIFRLLIDDGDEDNNIRYCAIQPGITLELTIQGCGGLRTFQYFLIKNLPAPYSHRDVIFRIIDVTQNISQEGIGWETKITAGLLPLRNYIKKRLTPPKGGWVEPTRLPQ